MTESPFSVARGMELHTENQAETLLGHLDLVTIFETTTEPFVQADSYRNTIWVGEMPSHLETRLT